MIATAQSNVSFANRRSPASPLQKSAAKVSHSSIKSVFFFCFFLQSCEALDLILRGENVNRALPIDTQTQTLSMTPQLKLFFFFFSK